MKDTVVTVRMPTRLVRALDEQVAEGHFLDFSEAVRSIIRNRYLEAYPLQRVTEREERKRASPQGPKDEVGP